ncbi:hypothetical protein DYB25_003074 [Aphanomyces astaci]|uniref:Uncharacterized protein n=1 Tax=Aphanomyces astaci TaxID=112090 RepID=A0A397BBC7_APHAT|nr:hypothetical protein DYB25_003074 [Aphanomyces astaci]
MGDSVEDSAVNDFLQILEEHRKNCEKQGKYVEAEIAKNRLDELKVHEENRRKEAMRSRQIAERLGVEEAHMLEFQQFNLVWDRKMEEYERNVDELVASMRDRHQGELLEFQQKLLEKQIKPKFSKELLNLRKIEEHLARQKEYAANTPHKMKLKSDALEAWEMEKWRNSKQQEMFQREIKFKQRQRQELEALQKRIQSGREEQKKQRQLDLERLLQRYQNVKAELQQQQNLERIRIEKFSLTTTQRVSMKKYFLAFNGVVVGIPLATGGYFVHNLRNDERFREHFHDKYPELVDAIHEYIPVFPEAAPRDDIGESDAAIFKQPVHAKVQLKSGKSIVFHVPFNSSIADVHKLALTSNPTDQVVKVDFQDDDVTEAPAKPAPAHVGGGPASTWPTTYTPRNQRAPSTNSSSAIHNELRAVRAKETALRAELRKGDREIDAIKADLRTTEELKVQLKAQLPHKRFLGLF